MSEAEDWRPEGLGEEESRAVFALLEGCTQAQAAERAGVCDRTLRRWRERKAFRLALRQGRDMLLRDMATQLHARTKNAIDALMAEMETPTAHGVSRVMAARTILELSLKAADRVDHSERLREIEAEVAAGKEVLARLEGQGQGVEGQGSDRNCKLQSENRKLQVPDEAVSDLDGGSRMPKIGCVDGPHPQPLSCEERGVAVNGGAFLNGPHPLSSEVVGADLPSGSGQVSCEESGVAVNGGAFLNGPHPLSSEVVGAVLPSGSGQVSCEERGGSEFGSGADVVMEAGFGCLVTGTGGGNGGFGGDEAGGGGGSDEGGSGSGGGEPELHIAK